MLLTYLRGYEITWENDYERALGTSDALNKCKLAPVVVETTK